MGYIEEYNRIYDREPEAVAFCPYRISPLGAHIDYQFGVINGLAIDKGIHIAYSAKSNGVVELKSLNFPKRAQFHVVSVLEEKVGDWADHLRGTTKMLEEKYLVRIGMSVVIEGTLLVGGFSSSTAVIIVFLTPLCKLNHIKLSDWELIMMAKKAENQYVGVNCGKLDQCRKDQLLCLDCKDDSYQLIPTSLEMKHYDIVIFFSGLERSLANSKYNLRQEECNAVAYNLLAYAGLDFGKFIDTRLCDGQRMFLGHMVPGFPKTSVNVPSISTQNSTVLLLKRRKMAIWRSMVSWCSKFHLSRLERESFVCTPENRSDNDGC